MSTIPSHRAIPNSSLPANLLLSSPELRQYRRWQGLFTSTQASEQGGVNTALQYNDFRLWLAKQDSGYFSGMFEDLADHLVQKSPASISAHNVPFARICRHVMHPAACATRWTRCPPCTIDVHLDYMNAVTRSMKSAAGRPLPGTGTPSEHQEILFRAWVQAKLETLRQLSELERLAEEEEEWSRQNEAIQCEGIKTAQEALKKYWTATSGHQPDHRETHSKKQSIEFASNTKYEPGRNQHYFWRRSPRYNPGKYTTVDEDDQEDQDVSEDSEDYTVSSAIMVGYCETQRQHDGHKGQDAEASAKDVTELQSDDEDSDWSDAESVYGDESSDSSYICFEIEEETAYITFSDE